MNQIVLDFNPPPTQPGATLTMEGLYGLDNDEVRVKC